MKVLSSRLSAIIIFIFSMLIYLFTLAPTVTGEDSGELAAGAYDFGVVHPSGYPLWTLLGGLMVRLFPFASPVYITNLLSAILASLSAVVLFITLKRFFQISNGIAITGALSFACGSHLWSQAVITEVYTLHIFLLCLIIYTTFCWMKSLENKYLFLTSFLCGLALSNHHLATLIGPILFVTVLICKPKVFISAKAIISCLFFLCLGLLPYLYLPLAASGDPYMNWGDPSSWDRFVQHVTRQQYSDDSMKEPRTLTSIWFHLKTLASWNTIQYTIFAIPFILTGICVQYFKFRSLFYFTLGAFLVHSIGLAELINFQDQRIELFAARVFFIPAYIFTAIWLILGIQYIGKLCFSKLSSEKMTACITLIASVLFIVILTKNFNDNNFRYYYYAYDHAKNILESLDENAILFPSGDHNTFPTLYLNHVENIRPDVLIADKYGYIEYDVYKDMPDAPERIRTIQEREAIEAYLIRYSERPVYYTTKPRLTFLPDYDAISYGMLYRIVKREDNFQVKDLPKYHYRNLDNTLLKADHASFVIMSDYYFHLAANELRQENITKAKEHLDKAAELSEGLKEEMNNIATLYAEFGLVNEAIHYYEKAAMLDKKYLTPRWNLARLFKANGDQLHAIQVFNDLAKLDKEDFRVYGELGFLLAEYGEPELAIKNWGKSLGLNPTQPQILDTLTQLNRSLNQIVLPNQNELEPNRSEE